MKRAAIVIAIIAFCFVLGFFMPAISGFSISDFFKSKIGVSADCSDHLDNDGNGYCDSADKNGYCEDGSILGDPNCDRDSSETALCKPKEEKCNGLDDDCDGQIDENLIDTRSCGKDTGECKQGTESRNCFDGEYGAWSVCENAVWPSREICDGLDNNCNGKVDEGCK